MHLFRFARRALLVLLPASGAAQTAGRQWSAEELLVIEAASTGPVGIENDFDRWSDGYHPSWTYWRMGTDEIRRRDAHMELVRGVLREGNRVTNFELTPVDVIVRGDTALLRYNAEETIVSVGGESQVIRSSAVSLFAKERDRWLVIASSLFYPESQDD